MMSVIPTLRIVMKISCDLGCEHALEIIAQLHTRSFNIGFSSLK